MFKQIIAAISLPFSCHIALATPQDTATRALAGMNDRLWAEYSKVDGNLVYSPTSIALATAILTGGAASKTESELLRAFTLDAKDSRELHPAFASLLKGISAPELSFANRLWAQESFGLLEPFLRITREHYGAESKTLPFARNTEGSRKEINHWVSNETQGKIPELLKPGILNELTRLVLTNAVYFKGKWETAFSREATRSEPFHMTSRDSKNVPMMHLKSNFRYAEDSDLQLLELPYQENRLSAIILLPKPGKSLKHAVKLSARIEDFIKTADAPEVEVVLPRFKFRTNSDIKPILQKIGIQDAFSPERADFTRIAPAKGLYLSAVIHEALVDVNEEGTEAAAATAAVVALRGIPSENRRILFKADRPFLFVIRENNSGAILFVVRVEAPYDEAP